MARPTASNPKTALTERQRRFVAEYLKDENGAAAAVRAGYAQRSARQSASNNLAQPEIAAAITAARQARIARVQADADYVLRRMIEIDQMDVLDILTDDMNIKPVSEWPAVWRSYLSGFDLAEIMGGSGDERAAIGILKKIKWPDKVRNLEMLGRAVGMFKQQVEHSGEVRSVIVQASPLDEAL